MASKVFFTNLRTDPDHHLLYKLEKLVRKAGIETIDFKDKFTAVKIHFGEPGNMAYLRPDYAAVIVRIIRELGGKPFLTDCNTLYTGGRSNALDHQDTAARHGYTPFSTGAQVIIADGLKGLDYIEVPVDGEYCNAPKIGAAIAESDIVISINHVKGHEMTGFGGALKNLGMGCGSVAGKKEMHSASKPRIDLDACRGCGLCVRNCASGAISLKDRKAFIDYSRCVGCGQCVATCQCNGAIADNDEQLDILNCKIAEYAKATLKGKQNFHISLIMDVSPECDCWCYNDAPVVPNIGIAASFDPVALDCACADLVNNAPVMPSDNVLAANRQQHSHDHGDHWHMIHPDTNWRSCVEHAEKIGIGSRDYELQIV
ncbi:MAG: DUF362 domain-containing protein [Bacteroidaceae bacterium]|nr:DUF362 domain-containing protein [Bacteroidaceae bacterium]